MKLALSWSTGLLLCALAMLPGADAHPLQQPAFDCEGWNTEEFFTNASVELVASCLNVGADLGATTDDGHTPLHFAAQFSEDPAVVKTLLEAGADLSAAASSDGHLPVHEAATNPNADVLDALIAVGADPKALTKSGATPLHFAARNNENPAVIKALIAAGAAIEAKDDRGFTPLHRAANFNESLDVLKALVSAGADVNVPTENGIVPLQSCAFANQNPAVLEALVKAGADPNVKFNGETLLHLASRNNENSAVIDALLAADAEIEARDDNGNTPLHRAANFNESLDVIEALISAGADVKTPDDDGYAPIQSAAWANQNPAVIEALIAAGANPNVRAEDGRTPLHMASQNNENPEVIEALLKAGADKQARTNDGRTPLHMAARSNENMEVVEALLAAGAQLGARTEDGATPLGYALSTPWRALDDQKQQEQADARLAAVAELLLDAGADPNAMTGSESFHNVLHAAVYVSGRENVWTAIVRRLLAAGANPDGTGPHWRNSPLQLAGKASRGAVEALLASGADVHNDFGDTGICSSGVWSHEASLSGSAAGTVLEAAADNNDVAVIEMILAAGADPNVGGPLHAAAYCNDNPAVLEALLDAGANPNVRLDGSTPLHLAAASANAAAAAVLLSAGADPGAAAEGSGNTPLHYLAEDGRSMRDGAQTVEALLGAGADPNARNEDGETPWDLVQEVLDTGGVHEGMNEEDLRALQQGIRQSAAYWRLNDARFEAASGTRAGAQSRTHTRAPAPQEPQSPANRSQSPSDAQCLIPGFPRPADPESLGFPWCPASVGFQVRAFAISAAGAQCAIATGTSSTPEQIAARRKETADLCTRLDTVNERLGSGGGPDCRCPADWR